MSEDSLREALMSNDSPPPDDRAYRKWLHDHFSPEVLSQSPLFLLEQCWEAAEKHGRARDQERIAISERLLGGEIFARVADQERIVELEAGLHQASIDVHYLAGHEGRALECQRKVCAQARALLGGGEAQDAE